MKMGHHSNKVVDLIEVNGNSAKHYDADPACSFTREDGTFAHSHRLTSDVHSPEDSPGEARVIERKRNEALASKFGKWIANLPGGTHRNDG